MNAHAPDLRPIHPVEPPSLVDATRWYDVRALGLEGQGWSDTERPFDRWPARAQQTLPPTVWALGGRCAGLRARFVTDATSIAAQWTLTREELALEHMPASGASGLDLYAMHQGHWRYAGATRPKALRNHGTLVSNMQPISRQFLVNLPLYNGIESLRIGVPEAFHITAAPAYPAADPRPICFYGTSINQGGCASRPGMCHIAILQRRLNRAVINLGFGGAAKCELEVARLLAELDPCLFVIDPYPNLKQPNLAERLPPFLRILRNARPTTPILLMGAIQAPDVWINVEHARVHAECSTAFRDIHRQLLAEGMPHLHHMPSDDLLGQDGDATVDGTHPTDAGFLRIAGALEPVLRRLLEPGEPPQ